jgi:Uma2 family endonuclease
MSTTPALISVEEYLSTSYHPDCDYIDGQVLERNMGETPHARLQGFFFIYFSLREEIWRTEALLEQRLQINDRKYRIPDVMLVELPNQDKRIVRKPPLLCVEILSSEDRMKLIQERIIDYAQMGVQTSWVVDPWTRTAYAAGPDGILHPISDRLTVPNTQISIEVQAIFAELDRLEKRATRE